MTKNVNKAAAATAINYATASIDELMEVAGADAYRAGEGVAVANKQRASALDMMIVALASGGLFRPVAVEVLDAGGNVVESSVETFDKYAAGFRNADGSDHRKKQGAFRSRALSELFRVPGDQSAGAKATWTLAVTKALPTAMRIVGEGMSASLSSEGKLVLDGGEGEAADAIKAAAAKSTSALVKAAKGETGTNRDKPGNDKGGDLREATPSEITRTAVALAKLIAKGDTTACNATMSNLREIARLVAGNPDAFADD